MNRRFRIVLAQSIALGAFTGLFGLAYLIGVEELTHLLWGDDWATGGWFSGSIEMLVIPVAAGLAVGLVYKLFRLPPRFHGFIKELEDGVVEPKTAPGAVGVAVISLISGPSLGPEAPLGTAGGAAGTWLARRFGGDEEVVNQLSFVGISGAFGGLMSTPVGGPLLAFELEHDQTHGYYFNHLVPGVIAGAASFAIMWPVIGAPFEGLLALPHPEFKSWMLAVGAGIGVVSAIAAVVTGKLTLAITNVMKRFDNSPIVRGVIGGAAVGLIAIALPLTLFSGQTTLPVIFAEFDQLGLAMLIALAIFKAAALGASLGGGFYGGPIFPMFFMGATLGVAVHVIFPEIPIALAVGSMMAGLGAAAALLPLSMAVLASVLIGSGYELFGALALASVTAYAVRVVLGRRATRGDMQAAAQPEPTS